MKEIIGERMHNVFAAVGVNPKETFKGRIGYWNEFTVWEITDEDFEALCNMSDRDFKKHSQDLAWWRYAEGSNQDEPNHEFIINGEKITAWYDEDRDEDLAEDFENENEVDKEGGLEAYIATWHTTTYDKLIDYLNSELGASTERNVCALAVDLAAYNNITMSELFRKYGG